jgi:hypothetical protein
MAQEKRRGASIEAIPTPLYLGPVAHQENGIVDLPMLACSGREKAAWLVVMVTVATTTHPTTRTRLLTELARVALIHP